MGTLIPSLETYQYTSLRPAESSFRLLKLLKYRGPEIECELFQQSLSNNKHTPYEALSYVWGSTELVECITVDRKRHWITDSLYAALHYLRLHDRDRYLWIDAICINQTDKDEQSWQVQQMGKIFGSAESVLFWLGKATLEVTSLMDALKQHSRAGEKLTLNENLLDDCRTGLRQLLRRQWFTRVWILQEVANAQKATVCCSTRSIPAEVFASAPSLLGEEPEPHCQPILEIMPGPSRSGSWWSQRRDLRTLLRQFAASKATDERDKIYALLGMSSDPLDTQSIDIDYKKPTHEVIHQVITYLLRSTSTSIHEVLNLMCHFETLETTFFVLPFPRKEATDILFPSLQSGNTLKPGESAPMSQGIFVVNDPEMFLLEKRPERNSKEQTYHSQVVDAIGLGRSTDKPEDSEDYEDYEEYKRGLQVISWGNHEYPVKMVIVHNRVKAILLAALQGCSQVMKHLLHFKIGDEERDTLEAELLETASKIKNEQIVKLLLAAGVNVNAQGGRYGNALQAATFHGHYQIIKLLLDAGADVNAQGGMYGSALQAASYEGAEEVVRMLLAAGVNVNAQGGRYGNALQAATCHGHYQIIKLLLDAGADVNAQGGIYGSALQAASYEGAEEVVRMLLYAGADVNAQCGRFGNALVAASYVGAWKVVRMLLDAGADVNAQGGEYGTALRAASYRRDEKIVRMLLDAGADVNAQGGEHGTALRAASYRRDEKIVRMLLDAGADVNIRGEDGTALSAALKRDHKQIVKLLRDKGATE